MGLKRKKPTVRTQLKNWSKAVRDRDGNKCAICGSEEHIQAHHIVQKKFSKDLRFDVGNGIALCPKHHSFGAWSAHMGSFFFSVWLEENRPNQFAYLKAKVLRGWEEHNEGIR